MPSLIDWIFFAPMPFSPSSLPVSIAVLSSSMLVMPRCFQNSEHRDQAGGDAKLQFLHVRRRSRADEVFDDLPRRLADAGHVRDRPILDGLSHVDGHVFEQSRDLSKRDRLKDRLPLDFHNGSGGLEQVGDGGVGGHQSRIIPAAPNQSRDEPIGRRVRAAFFLPLAHIHRVLSRSHTPTPRR
jgi:hypothetical protein